MLKCGGKGRDEEDRREEKGEIRPGKLNLLIDEGNETNERKELKTFCRKLIRMWKRKDNETRRGEEGKENTINEKIRTDKKKIRARILGRDGSRKTGGM